MATVYQQITKHVKEGCTGLLFVLFFALCLQAQPHIEKNADKQHSIDPLLVKEYILNEHGSLNVLTISGDIEVVHTGNTRKVRIELYADQGFSFWSYGNPLENYRLTSLKRGNDISTSVEAKKKHKSRFWGGQTSFSYKITVPKTISTTLKTLNGSVSLQNVNGDHLVKSNAGSINVDEVNGVIKAYSTGGDINIKNSKGTVFARADGGNIRSRNVNGELRFKVHAGKVVSSRISGSMVAEVNAGDIEAAFNEVGEGINLQTNAGSINLTIPKSLGYGLQARGDRVLFDEQAVFRGTRSGRLADGLINGGGTPVNLTANAGKITIQLKK